MSFDICVLVRSQTSTSLNPFWAGRCLSTFIMFGLGQAVRQSQSLSSRAMSFDVCWLALYAFFNLSQSLSSRAMSFDVELEALKALVKVSIPFEQGDVFRPYLYHNCDCHHRSQSLSSRAMSFDLQPYIWYSLRPWVSIPFEQGDVFRLVGTLAIAEEAMSQSLSNRAMSFDLVVSITHVGAPSQSLSNRAMSFDQKKKWYYRPAE